jgi:hypothetical protein
MKSVEMSGTCSTYKETEKYIQLFGPGTLNKRKLRIPSQRCEDNIKVDLKNDVKGE